MKATNTEGLDFKVSKELKDKLTHLAKIKYNKPHPVTAAREILELYIDVEIRRLEDLRWN